MTDTTKRTNLEDKVFECFCRDRDTRVLRAVIAAASRHEDATPAPPDRHTDLQRPILGNRGNTMVRVVDVLVREGVLPGELLMAAWMTLPGVPMAAQTLDDVRAFVADVDARPVRRPSPGESPERSMPQ
ncbi:MAG TPA: hypothetical protein VEA78_09755 [Acidimicrobiales bacterium]|nr:hypothetical protein [Acidimicrobiales bacterium]